MGSKLVYSFFLMLISPAFTLYYGLKSNDVNYKRWLLIIFITIYGSIIYLTPGMDGTRHQSRVYTHYEDLSFAEFGDELLDILFFDPEYETNDDVYIHVLSFFTGGVLGSPGLFFVFVAFIYAYFFSGSVFKVLRLIPGTKISWFFYAFAVVFIMWKNIEGINTVRTWTGMWVLFYGAISYFETKNWKYLVLMALPPFIHIGYFVMVLPTWAVVIGGVRPKFYAIIFGLSFVTTVNQSILIEQAQKTELGTEKVDGYYVEEEASFTDRLQSQSGSTWYRKLFKIGVQYWGINIIAAVLILFGIYSKYMTAIEAKLFSVGLLTKVLSNYTFFIFALQTRSNIISTLFILAALILILKRGYLSSFGFSYGQIQKMFLSIGFALLVPFLVFRLADMIYFLSIFIVGFPFFPWFFSEINISIREALGNFF